MPFQSDVAISSDDPGSGTIRLFQTDGLIEPASGRRVPGAGLSVLLAFIEITLLAAVVIAALMACRPSSTMGWASWIALLVLPISTLFILTKRQFYATNHLLFAPFAPFRIVGAWIGAFGATVVVATLARGVEPQRLHNIGMVPRELAFLFGAGLTSLLAGRSLWMLLRPRFAVRAVPRVLFIGALDASRRLLGQLHGEATINLVTTLDYRESGIGPAAAGGSYARANHERLADLLNREAIDAILVALPQMPPAEIGFIATVAQQCGVTTVALPGASLRRDPTARFTTLGGVPVLRPDTTRLTRAGMMQKRLFDLALGIFVLVIIVPVMVVVALLIKLDSHGPVLFRQLRVGRGGVLFEILKFRTMTHVAPPQTGDESAGALQTSRNDQRITRLGAILRRHSLDELPQIFNVLRGDMSIIGPRPHAAAMTVEGMQLEALVPDYTARFAVRPGITGWAQIKGRRGIIDTASALEHRVDCDLYYIENWSIAFDLSILFRTILCVIRDDHAF